MPHSSICLLVADEHTATVFESREGCSRLVRTVDNAAMPAAKRWPNTGKVVPLHARTAVAAAPRDHRRDFAFRLTIILLDAAEAGTCDGIIVAATKEMLEALRRVRPLALSRLLIAEIVQNENSTVAVKQAVTVSAPNGNGAVPVSPASAFDQETFAEMRHA